MADDNVISIDSLGDAVGSVINSQNQKTAGQIKNNIQGAVGVNPEQEASYQNLARFTATPIESVRAQPEAIKQKASVAGVDAEDITTKSPNTARFLTDPTSAKLAIDDIANMRDLESHVANVGLAEGLVNSFALSSYRTYQGARTWWGDKTDNEAMVNDAINNLQVANEAEPTLVPQMDTTLGRWTYGAAQSVLNMAPALGLAAINPLVSVAAFTGQSKAESYGRYRARGGTEDEAGLGSNLEAGVTAVTSFVPIHYLTSKLGKTPAVQFIANLLVRDVGTEVAQTVAQSAIDTAIANPDKSWKDWVKELPENVGQATTAALMFTATFGAVNAGMQKFQGAEGKLSMSEQSTGYIERLNEMATNSKLRTRDPERFAKFIQEATAEAPVQDLYVNANDLAQSGIDPLQLGAMIPTLKDEIANAMQTGVDLKIPVADFATHLAGTELGQSMVDHLKIDPNAFSKAQSEKYMKDEGGALQAEVEKVLAEKQGDEAFKASRDAVREEVTRQLKAAGRFTDDVNAPYATMLSNFYSVQAARLGISPEEMFAKYPVNIQSESAFGNASLGSDVDQRIDGPNSPFKDYKGPEYYGDKKATKLLNTLTDTKDFIPAELPISRLIATQPEVNDDFRETLNNIKNDGYDLPAIVKYKGGYFIADGHHRLTAMADRGDTNAKVRLFDLDGDTQTSFPLLDELNQSATDANKPQRSDLGFYSAVERETLSMNIPSWKKDGAAKGGEVWEKLKSLPVKKEELEWLGIEDYLTSKHSKEKFTRQDVVDFIRENGVKVEEIVGDQEGADFQGFDWNQEKTDDPDYISFRADDIASDMRDGNSPREMESVYAGLIRDEYDYIKENYEGALPESSAIHHVNQFIDSPEGAALSKWLDENFADTISDKIDEAAQEIAQEEYDDNPYFEWTEENGYTIRGNDDGGYTMESPSGRRIGDVVYSFSEAEIQVQEYAMESGDVQGDNGPNTAKWADYTADGDKDNYRELKLTLPGIQDTFVKGSHFDDENIVAFLRVDDREFVKSPEQNIEGRDSAVIYKVIESPTVDGMHEAGFRLQALDDTGEVRQQSVVFKTREEAEAQIPADAATKTVRIGDKKISRQMGKAYFIEEFQSDWHQAGREHGYKGEKKAPDTTGFTAQKIDYDVGDGKTQTVWKILDAKGFQKGDFILADHAPTEEAAIALYVKDQTKDSPNAAPDAPFKDDAWISLGVKRAIIDAVEKGYDRIAWVDGQTLVNRWSERYRTLYETQYDKKMPSIFKKITGETPRRVSEDSVQDSSQDLTDGDGYWEIEITDKLRERITGEGLPLFQKESGNRRGSFNTETNAITLFKAADLSTFLHESGHFFLETMNKIALDANAPDEIKADMDATLKWLGVKDMADWNGRTLEEKRETHEQFARGFEAYLFEGKSPNKAMGEIFQRFRAWLTNIYRNIHALNVDVSDDMKAVFDRMLATSDEIKAMEAERAYTPFFAAAEEAGMTKEEFTAYQNLGIEATQAAQHALESRSLRDMKYASNAKSKVLKDLQKQVAAKRNSIRREVTNEVMAEPVNQVQTFLKRGIDPVTGEKVEGAYKLYIPELEAMYGDTSVYKMITEKLGYGKYGMLGTENGLHPNQVADMFGFGSADEMIRAILAAENPKEKIQGITDQRMLERYGDINSEEALSRAADEAIHNDVRMKFVATEMNALQKAIGGRKILADAARKYAESMVNRLKVRDLKASVYTNAESRSARAADLLRKDGDLQGAAIQKRNQLINMYAARATHDAQDFIEKSLAYLKKFDKDTVRKSVDAEYVDQINTMLERFSLRTQSLKAIDKHKSLVDWVEGQKAIGIEPDISPELLNEAYRKNYKDMTVEEMRGLVDAVKQVEHLGRLKNKLLTAKDKRDFETTVNGLITSVQDNAGNKVADNRTRANYGVLGRLFKGYFAQHRKVASLARELDGFKDGGPMWETFIRTMNEAGDREAVMRSEATIAVGKLLDPILKRGSGRMGGKGLYFDSVKRSLNREERIGIALNTGNEGNMQRLLGGEGWTRAQIEPILDTLTKEDWDFVQNVWDHFESYRPLIGAKERRVYGKEPDWVDPSPVQTKFGEYKGGYYPIKYDPRQSIKAEQHADADAAKAQLQGAYTSATTRRSFTKSRVEEVTGRPLLYSMDGLYQGLNEVIHDLSWHEWLIDANRLLRNKGLDGAIRNRYGADFVKQFKTATEDIAAGEMPSSDALEKSLMHVRAGATVAGLGFNLMNSIINTTGVTQSIVRIGPKWVALGVGEWARSPIALTKQIYEKSAFMKLRGQTQQRELNEIRNRVSGKGAIRQGIDRFMFLPMEVTQLAVDAPSWWGAYQKALADGQEESRAVALADQAVLDSQSGGQVKDLAAIQRGNGFKKLFTTFYGFFSSAYNLSVERTKATNFKDPRQILNLAGDYLLLSIMPSVMGTLIKSALTNGTEDFEDPEKLAKMLANDQLSYLMGMMVGLREMTGAAQTIAGVNTYNTGYGGPAGLRVFNELYKLSQQVNQGEADAALRRSVVNVAGVTLHLPSTQVNRTLDGLTAIWDGKTSNPAALVTGGPKD